MIQYVANDEGGDQVGDVVESLEDSVGGIIDAIVLAFTLESTFMRGTCRDEGISWLTYLPNSMNTITPKKKKRNFCLSSLYLNSSSVTKILTALLSLPALLVINLFSIVLLENAI
eukprot:TRINITY_DN4164_c0_g1_i1.p3 TRINITY_DN4164_c0_g1~~TRINITY_DN4164_c0_g1_i1.p3  ORF type:complete len:115 (-),score=0.57 TRINITY_DN4164_c0_g1_i1:201-545(-)